MKTYRVRFIPAALDDLIAIFDWVAPRASARIAEGFVSRLEAACRSLDIASYRGTARDDLRPGMRTFGGVFYGGRSVEELAAGRETD